MLGLRAEGATLDDLREAVTTLESVAKAWKRVLGAAHPDTSEVQSALAFARNKLARAAADAARIARRVLGGAHPLTGGIEKSLQNARAVLAARDVD